MIAALPALLQQDLRCSCGQAARVTSRDHCVLCLESGTVCCPRVSTALRRALALCSVVLSFIHSSHHLPDQQTLPSCIYSLIITRIYQHVVPTNSPTALLPVQQAQIPRDRLARRRRMEARYTGQDQAVYWFRRHLALDNHEERGPVSDEVGSLVLVPGAAQHEGGAVFQIRKAHAGKGAVFYIVFQNVKV